MKLTCTQFVTALLTLLMMTAESMLSKRLVLKIPVAFCFFSLSYFCPIFIVYIPKFIVFKTVLLKPAGAQGLQGPFLARAQGLLGLAPSGPCTLARNSPYDSCAPAGFSGTFLKCIPFIITIKTFCCFG